MAGCAPVFACSSDAIPPLYPKCLINRGFQGVLHNLHYVKYKRMSKGITG